MRYCVLGCRIFWANVRGNARITWTIHRSREHPQRANSVSAALINALKCDEFMVVLLVLSIGVFAVPVVSSWPDVRQGLW